MPGLLSNSPYAGFDPKKDPYLLRNPPRDPSQVDTTGQLLKGQVAGLLGFPGDIMQTMVDVQAGANHVLPRQLPFTSNRIGGLLGANPQSRDFRAGLLGAPDPSDIARIAGKGLLAQALFHGTPHRFDKFDLKAIGTGEGAQAYGHGLYFAENPGVAQSYKNTITRFQPDQVKRQLVDQGISDDVAENFANLYVNQGAGVNFRGNTVFDEFEEIVNKPGPAPQVESFRERARAELPKLREASESIKEAGHIYEVDIPDETIGKMLDWDAPLSEQPESVRKALEPLTDFWKQQGTTQAGIDSWRGEQLYERAALLGNRLGITGGSRQEVASKTLQEFMGIPGIRYYDGSSRPKNVIEKRLVRLFEKKGGDVDATLKEWMRGVHESPAKKAQIQADLRKKLENRPTRNIVVFNPDDIREVKRDGELVYKTQGL